MKKSAMVINNETAMKFWVKSYGKATRVRDFAGREMDKAAYGQRGSKFGWNIDHILPQSRGGKTNESNLICCHILTNDEKADKFPCFTANGKRFEIVKVENHYEIREITSQTDSEIKDEIINFYDSSAGVKYFKDLKEVQNKQLFVGTIIVTLKNVKSTAIIDFVSEIFAEKGIYVKRNYYGEIIITIKDNSLPQKENIADLLDRCVLLNTYLDFYFVPTDVICSYSIFYGVHTKKDKIECLSSTNECTNNSHKLMINELVRKNTKANERLETNDYIGRDTLGYYVYPYNYIFTQLSENLKKSIS